MSARKPEVTKCVREFIEGSVFEPSKFLCLEECLKYTRVWNEIQFAFKNVYASPEFPNVTTDMRYLFLLVTLKIILFSTPLCIMLSTEFLGNIYYKSIL